VLTAASCIHAPQHRRAVEPQHCCLSHSLQQGEACDWRMIHRNYKKNEQQITIYYFFYLQGIDAISSQIFVYAQANLQRLCLEAPDNGLSILR
jgi:hypothetical protein